jgi:hypothetical protein
MAMLRSYADPAHFVLNTHYLTGEIITVHEGPGAGASARWMMLQVSTYRDGRSDLRSAAIDVEMAPRERPMAHRRFVTENIFSRDVGPWNDRPPFRYLILHGEKRMSSTDYAALVKDDRVHTALYKDSAIFDEEMERIFKNTWVWVGHESELPGPNTFKKSFVGNQPVIVTRDKAGEIRTLLNRCRHRAASVCEKKKGRQSVFVCLSWLEL